MDMNTLPQPRRLANGMGLAVAKRTVFRESDQNSWSRVATRVAKGNLSLVNEEFHASDEYLKLRAAISSGAFLTSGRHLQHGDLDQKNKCIEIHSNCSTSATNFLSFYLLLCGSGVGRCYDDAMIVVDWANAPELAVVLSRDHKDYPKTNDEAKEFLSSFVPHQEWSIKSPLEILAEVLFTEAPLSEKETIIYRVEDSREGWAKALELYETMAYKKESDKLLVLDFSEIRPLGAPIHGIQGRPCSGPLSVARGFLNCIQHVVKPAIEGKLKPWKQNLIMDHYFAQEVQIGGVRRSARAAVKYWKDEDILDFITCKSKGGLWTANNSVSVDAEFWTEAKNQGSLAETIFNAITESSYINGEPGFLNVDKLEDAVTGFDRRKPPIYKMESKRYKVKWGLPMLTEMSEKVCISGDTEILTIYGWKKVTQLIGEPFIAIVNGYEYVASGFWCNGKKAVYEVKTDKNHSVKVTWDHEIRTINGWCPLSLLKPGMALVLPTDKTSAMETALVTEICAKSEEFVYDCNVPDVNCYNGNGLLLHNCGHDSVNYATIVNPCFEIPLSITGGYCVIADVAPLLACPVPFNSIKPGKVPENIAKIWDSRIVETLQLASRFLLRVNKMDALYGDEVKRTQRIGVGLTGIHEWAWLRYGYGFLDLLDEHKTRDFWAFVRFMSDETKIEANNYSQDLKINKPVTVTTAKPAGSTAKLFNITEGVHLPARKQYLRWVQFRGFKLADGSWEATSDPLLAEYEAAGYPLKELKTFPGMTVVGFPTKPTIAKLGMGDKLVTAKEATPEQQYKWLQLLEKYWLGPNQANQLSYTLKVDVTKHNIDNYRKIVLENQPKIKCCAILPIKPDHLLGYEYLPEEEVIDEVYEACVKRISGSHDEDIDIETLICEGGSCPL